MRPTVVVSLLTSDQEFQQMQAADARATAQRLGVALEVMFAENNAVQQIHQIYQHIHATGERRPAAIVVEAVRPEGMERLARNAVRAGIGWLAQQRADYLDELRREARELAIAAVTVDEEEIGRIQARQFRALLPHGGGVLFLQGPAESETAVRRLQGLQHGLVGSGIELRAVLKGDWTDSGAARAVASWLRLGTTETGAIELVGAQNDSMATGARRVLLEARREWTTRPFTGCDGLPNGGRRLVAEGVLAATIVKPTTTGPAIELVVRRTQGQPIPPELVLRSASHPAVEELAGRA